MTAAEILRIHNAWRRGEGEWADKTIADLPFTNQQLGEAIDEAVRRMERSDETRSNMKSRFKYPIAGWPWYLRWTLGALCFVALVIPVAVFGALWEALRDAALAYHRSEAWHMIAVSFAAIVLGDRDE